MLRNNYNIAKLLIVANGERLSRSLITENLKVIFDLNLKEGVYSLQVRVRDEKVVPEFSIVEGDRTYSF